MNYPSYPAHAASMHDPYAAASMMATATGAEYTYGGTPATFQAGAMPYDYAAAAKMMAPAAAGYHQQGAAAAAAAAMAAGAMGGGPAGSAGALRMAATNTNSKDPKAVKSRVFVGNLNTNIITREQIHQIYAPFGEILAISVHKGYAFVQYAYENEARNAVTFTDGTLLGGKRIDVTVSSEPKNANVDDSTGVKRSANVTIPLGSDAKKMKFSGMGSYSMGGMPKKMGVGGAYSLGRSGMPTKPSTGSAGGATAANGNATVIEVKKPEGEPDSLQCFICHAPFEHSWYLLEHMSQKHSMTVYELPNAEVVKRDSQNVNKEVTNE